jgi:hypothetical protein
LLSRTPNLFFYSDAGNGLNYNYIKKWYWKWWYLLDRLSWYFK